MPNSLATWCLGLSLTLGLQGCLFQDLEVLAVEDFSDVQLSLNGFQARLVVDVYNPNPYPVTVFEADVALTVEQDPIGQVVLLAPTVIRPDARGEVELEVRTMDGALARLLTNDLMSLLRGSEVPFVAEGTVMGKAFGLRLSIPFRHTENLTLRP
jgi:LEA14-like dessication related protein